MATKKKKLNLPRLPAAPPTRVVPDKREKLKKEAEKKSHQMPLEDRFYYAYSDLSKKAQTVDDFTSLAVYKEIVKMGKKNIPYLINVIDVGNWDWFVPRLIRDIAHDGPSYDDDVEASQRYRIRLRWLQWAKENGISGGRPDGNV